MLDIRGCKNVSNEIVEDCKLLNPGLSIYSFGGALLKLSAIPSFIHQDE